LIEPIYSSMSRCNLIIRYDESVERTVGCIRLSLNSNVAIKIVELRSPIMSFRDWDARNMPNPNQRPLNAVLAAERFLKHKHRFRKEEPTIFGIFPYGAGTV